jgi:hypothetical protein
VTELSRPVLALLSATFNAPGSDERADVARLRESLTVALRKCFEMPDAAWPELVARGAVVGEWDQWRVAALVAAGDPSSDPEPDATRDALATLAEELMERRNVRAGPWEGGARQAAVETPRWRAGRLRREIVVAIERSMTCLPIRDAAGLRGCADRIAERDVTVAYPGLPDALRACASDVERGALGVAAREALGRALASTPFGYTVGRLAAE